MAEFNIIHTGYSYVDVANNVMKANATCTYIRTPTHSIIFDTLNPWNADIIKTRLAELNVEKIDFVVSSHSHPDHTGNNHLFLNAKHIVGYSVFQDDQFIMHPFDKGIPFTIDEFAQVVATPGHTGEDITLKLKTKDNKIVSCVGDLFEREEDIFEDPSLWLDNSSNIRLQAENRLNILMESDAIIPGHGPIFQVTESHREAVRVFLAEIN